jgi:hypothetical protein
MMRKVDVSTKQMAKFAGKWVVINPKKDRIVAVGNDLKEIGHLVTHLANEESQAVGESLYSFLVPRKDEGPYVLCLEAR